ncbi:hypothetical protein A6B43_08665 [Vespertiliibacter pulmonis]|nr:hypothetical protein A6B43_00140 [Vespertiliibacter pulmonis]QLB21591.1 hypothetical protein A6B43_08665 [Vespertiliibacter pulmonis]
MYVIYEGGRGDIKFHLFLALIFFIIYLTVIKNKIAFWINFLSIFFLSAAIIQFLPQIIVYKMKYFSLNYFHSYKEIKDFSSIVGFVFLLLFWYLWTGTENIFLSYKVLKPTWYAKNNKVNLTNLYDRIKAMKCSEILINPIVISVLIVIIGVIIAIWYYRYSDPYNQCQRELRAMKPNATNIYIIQSCNKIMRGK